jgi:hypothetical protein
MRPLVHVGVWRYDGGHGGPRRCWPLSSIWTRPPPARRRDQLIKPRSAAMTVGFAGYQDSIKSESRHRQTPPSGRLRWKRFQNPRGGAMVSVITLLVFAALGAWWYKQEQKRPFCPKCGSRNVFFPKAGGQPWCGNCRQKIKAVSPAFAELKRDLEEGEPDPDARCGISCAGGYCTLTEGHPGAHHVRQIGGHSPAESGYDDHETTRVPRDRLEECASGHRVLAFGCPDCIRLTHRR